MSILKPVPHSDRVSGPYTATAGQTDFAGTFYIQNDYDIAVTRTRGGVVTPLVLDTDYEVLAVDVPEGFTLRLLAPSLAGDLIEISGLATIDRMTSVVQAGQFNSRAVDREFDRNRIIDMEQRRDIDLVTPDPATRANSVQGYDSNGDVVALPLASFPAGNWDARGSLAGRAAHDAAAAGFTYLVTDPLPDGRLQFYVHGAGAGVWDGPYDFGFADGVPAELVTYTAPGAASAKNVKIHLERTVHADDYDGNLAAALAALPASGGVLELGRGSYVSPWGSIGARVQRKNIRIIGQAVPDYNHRTAPTALQGGSIIKGFSAFDADNLTIEGVGFDFGKDWCDANFGGTAQEGVWLGLPTASGGVRRYGVHMRDFALLGHQANSDIHDFIAINCEDGEVIRASSRLGGDGFVFFVRNMDVGYLSSRGHSKYCVLFKATADGDGRGVSASHIDMRSLAIAEPDWLVPAQFDTQGLVLEAAEADLRGMTLDNISAFGCINGVVLDGAVSFAVRDNVLATLHIERSAFQPILVKDNAARNRFIGGNCIKAGDGLLVSAGCSDTTFASILIREVNNYAISNSGTNTRIIACDQTANAAGGATGGLRNVTGSSRIEASVDFSDPVILAGTAPVGGKTPGITDNAAASYITLDASARAHIGGAVINNGKLTLHKGNGQDGLNIVVPGTALEIMQRFWNDGGTVVGSISTNGSATSFNTSCDDRLKEAIKVLDGAISLGKILDLKPSEYKFKADGSDGVGFIAHELQEVFPLAVTGYRDDVNEDGSIKPQQVDLSKLVPLLVAAVQGLAAEIAMLKEV
jgi:hypothetical protein